jgi:hypothetical protein
MSFLKKTDFLAGLIDILTLYLVTYLLHMLESRLTLVSFILYSWLDLRVLEMICFQFKCLVKLLPCIFIKTRIKHNDSFFNLLLFTEVETLLALHGRPWDGIDLLFCSAAKSHLSLIHLRLIF